MKLNFKKTIGLVNCVFILICFSSCNSDPIDTVYIKQQMWQYSNGEKLGAGDFIEFDSSYYEMKNDTLVYKEKKVAIIDKLKKDDNQLILTSLTSGNTSVYINVLEFMGGPRVPSDKTTKPKKIILVDEEMTIPE